MLSANALLPRLTFGRRFPRFLKSGRGLAWARENDLSAPCPFLSLKNVRRQNGVQDEGVKGQFLPSMLNAIFRDRDQLRQTIPAARKHCHLKGRAG